jgi:hypothetical protein
MVLNFLRDGVPQLLGEAASLRPSGMPVKEFRYLNFAI